MFYLPMYIFFCKNPNSIDDMWFRHGGGGRGLEHAVWGMMLGLFECAWEQCGI
jgi:hypothetical protein